MLGTPEGINGRQVGQVVLNAQNELDKLRKRIQALAIMPEEIDKHASCFENADHHWERVRGRVHSVYGLHQHRRTAQSSDS